MVKANQSGRRGEAEQKVIRNCKGCEKPVTTGNDR